MSDLLYGLAYTLPYWRSPAIVALVCIVIGSLTFFASVWDD